MARLTYQQFGGRFIHLAVTASVLTREFNKVMANQPINGDGKEGPASYLYTGSVLGFSFQPRPPEEFDAVISLKMDFKLRPLVGEEKLRTTVAEKVGQGLRDNKAARTIDVLKQIQGGMSGHSVEPLASHTLSEEALRCLSEADLSKVVYAEDSPALQP